MEPEAPSWRAWLIIALLTLLCHVLVLLSRVHWGPPVSAPRVEVQRIDPRKLDAIRREWARKNTQPQGLYIDKDKNRPSDKEAPPDARYMSDRNIRVEKEQRARNGTIAKQGLPGPPAPTTPRQERQQAPPQSQAQSPSQPMPRLGNLGLPFHLGSHKPKQLAENQKTPPRPPQQRAGQNGGEQAIRDASIPEGSENLLNAQESVYYSFYARLYDAIGPLWQQQISELGYGLRIQPGSYETNVDVVLDEEGNLVGINLERSSGISQFDQAVDRAWHKVGHFPNPPKGLLDGERRVHTGWSFTVKVGGGAIGLDFLPPERTY